MGDSSCVMHGFSYASALPNEAKQGNPVHVLGESISFGRFMTESLSWERWSTFSHKKYVEEAERYAQPGSVAQKKAFFEAHYKRIAAQKKAAEAALLEQENATNIVSQTQAEDQHSDDKSCLTIDRKEEDVEQRETKETLLVNENEPGLIVEPFAADGENDATTGNEALIESPIKENVINQHDKLQSEDTVFGSETSGTSQLEKPLLKHSKSHLDNPSVTSKKRPALSSLNSSIQHKTAKAQFIPDKAATPEFNKENEFTERLMKSRMDSADKRGSPPRSLRELINLLPGEVPDKLTVPATKKTETVGVTALSSNKAPKDCATPLKKHVEAAANGVQKYPAATPQSETRRTQTSIDPSSPGRKTIGPKWNIFSAVCYKSWNKVQSPTSTPTSAMRTEERTGRSKQKLEEKFNAKEVEKEQSQTKPKQKGGNRFRKLSYGLCFKARPVPGYEEERKSPKDEMEKIPVEQPKSAIVESNVLTKTKGTISMPPPPPPPRKNGAAKNVSNKNI